MKKPKPKDLKVKQGKSKKVRGGMTYVKWGGDGGEPTIKDHKGWSDLTSITYTRLG